MYFRYFIIISRGKGMVHHLTKKTLESPSRKDDNTKLKLAHWF